VDQAILQNNA
jgi:hypothetical protein